MMKHAEQTREAPKAAPEEVKQAYDILERHTWTSAERLAYEQAKIGLMDDLDAIRTARDEGKEEEKFKMAKKLLIKQKSIEEIMELTELTPEQIEQIKSLNR